MADMTCKQVATLTGGKWDKCLESNRRVYSTENVSPTITTCGGGNTEVKILDQPIAYDEQNDILRTDGTVGTITTDGSSPKHNNRVVEPIIYDDFNSRIKADQKFSWLSATNCGNDAPRNGVKLIDPNLRVRKLTERECFKLQGVKPKDFKMVAKHQSKSSCYHLAGDSICSPVLMAIFGELLGIDWRTKIDEMVEEIVK